MEVGGRTRQLVICGTEPNLESKEEIKHFDDVMARLRECTPVQLAVVAQALRIPTSEQGDIIEEILSSISDRVFRQRAWQIWPVNR